jgi:hypothetical protein
VSDEKERDMLFELQNYTHYNTDDLTALLRAVEAAIQEEGRVASRAFLKGWTRTGDRIEGIVAVKDFTSKKPHTEVFRGDDHKRYMVPNYIKQNKGWRNPAHGEIRIQPPHRLWLNPLDQLAGCAGETAEDESYLPTEAKRQLAERMVLLFDGLGQGEGPDGWAATQRVIDTVVATGPQVRIMGTRAATVDTAEKHRVARHRAHRTWSDTRHTVSRIEHHLDALLRSNASALNALARSKVPLTEAEGAADRDIRAVKVALEHAQQSLQLLSPRLAADSEN